MWFAFVKLNFNNPDNDECYADIKNQRAYDLLGSNSSMTNVGDQMRNWIWFGFLTYQIAPLCIILIAVVTKRQPYEIRRTFFDIPVEILHFILMFLLMFEGAMFFCLPLWGYFIRFEETGKICSGDYYRGYDKE